MPDVAVITVSDLMFQPRITAAVRALGLEPRVADTTAAAGEAIAAGPALVVVDLQDRRVQAAEVITAAKAAGARVLAFGRHTDSGALRAARKAGADTVVPRSQLVEELPQLIERLIGTGPDVSTR